MSKKKKNIDKRKKAAKARFIKMDKSILAASDALLTVSIDTGKKWQKLIRKSITVAEPIREKQIDMFFDTTDAVINQVEEGAGKFKNMLGIQEDISDMLRKQLDSKKIVNLLKNNASKLVKIATPAGVKKSIEQGAVKLKMEITERFSSDKPKKDKKKKSNKKKDNKKKSVKISKVKSKVTAKTKANKKASTPKKAAKKVITRSTKPAASKTRKAATRKTAAKPKVTRTRANKPTAARKAPVRAKKDDLKKVYGIGPKMESILHKNSIKTYAALSKMSKTKLQGIIDNAGFAYKAYKADQWTQQAAYASKGNFKQMETWINKNMK